MIFVVDDEIVMRDAIADSLQSAGFSVQPFECAQDALDAAATIEPQCILTDVTMPKMDGFAFFQEYQRRWNHRQTPFIFLTAHGEDEHVVRAFDLGVQDYLVKPVSPVVLAARLRAILSRCRRTASFVGDLSRLSMVRVLQFAEAKSITGELHVETPESTTVLRLQNGEIMDEDIEKLDQVFEASQGRFLIFPASIDFQEIADAAVSPSSPSAPREKPMGQLSGVSIYGRLFQVQTEFTQLPRPAYTTVVMLDGKTVTKKSTPADLSLSKSAIEEAMANQHRAMEAEIRRKFQTTNQNEKIVTSQKNSSLERYYQLLDEGYEHLREKRYESALLAMEEAAKINPTDKTLQLNLDILRRKLHHHG